LSQQSTIFRRVRRIAHPSARTSSVQTRKVVSSLGPNELISATSAASLRGYVGNGNSVSAAILEWSYAYSACSGRVDENGWLAGHSGHHGGNLIGLTDQALLQFGFALQGAGGVGTDPGLVVQPLGGTNGIR